ncbi:MAG: hypothetical protein ABI624_14045 [Casimicrobiaceae bacterium]
MSLAGKAVMINWSDVPVEHRPQYYEWHDREHIAGRVRIPGFRRGRRHIAVDADRDIFNLYEVDTLAVLTGEQYRAVADNPTEATRRAGKVIVNAIRALAHVRYSSGLGIGGNVQTLRFDAAEGAQRALSEYLIARALPALSALPDIVGVHLCVADREASTVVTSERKGRPTAVPNWAVIVEGTSAAAVRGATQELLPDAALTQHGATGPVARGTYALQIVIASGDV